MFFPTKPSPSQVIACDYKKINLFLFFFSSLFFLWTTGTHYCDSQFATLSTTPTQLLVLMSISVGGLGLMSIRDHFFELLRILLAKSAFRSMCAAILFLALVFILGESFRVLSHHLSHSHHLFFPKPTSQILQKFLFALISQNSPFVNISAASMTITKKSTLALQIFVPVIHHHHRHQHTVSTTTIQQTIMAHHSTLLIVLQSLYVPQSTISTTLAYSPLQLCSL